MCDVCVVGGACVCVASAFKHSTSTMEIWMYLVHCIVHCILYMYEGVLDSQFMQPNALSGGHQGLYEVNVG